MAQFLNSIPLFVYGLFFVGLLLFIIGIKGTQREKKKSDNSSDETISQHAARIWRETRTEQEKKNQI